MPCARFPVVAVSRCSSASHLLIPSQRYEGVPGEIEVPTMENQNKTSFMPCQHTPPSETVGLQMFFCTPRRLH